MEVTTVGPRMAGFDAVFPFIEYVLFFSPSSFPVHLPSTNTAMKSCFCGSTKMLLIASLANGNRRVVNGPNRICMSKNPCHRRTERNSCKLASARVSSSDVLHLCFRYPSPGTLPCTRTTWRSHLRSRPARIIKKRRRSWDSITHPAWPKSPRICYQSQAESP